MTANKKTTTNPKLKKLMLVIFDNYLKFVFHKDQENKFHHNMKRLNEFKTISEKEFGHTLQEFFLSTNIFNKLREELIKTNEEQKTMTFRGHLMIVIVNKWALCKIGKPNADYNNTEKIPDLDVANVISKIITYFESYKNENKKEKQE